MLGKRDEDESSLAASLATMYAQKYVCMYGDSCCEWQHEGSNHCFKDNKGLSIRTKALQSTPGTGQHVVHMLSFTPLSQAHVTPFQMQWHLHTHVHKRIHAFFWEDLAS